MQFSKISSFGRQVARSVLMAVGLTIATMNIGCGKAASEARIDKSIPEVDPAALAADAVESLETGATTDPEASESPAE